MKHFLGCCAASPGATAARRASGMALRSHSGAACLAAPVAQPRAGGRALLGSGWRDGEQHGPAHLLFHDGSYFVGNLSRGVPRRGFFGLPNGSSLHIDGTDPSYLTYVCKAPRPACLHAEKGLHLAAASCCESL